jgi:hypothetical protein
MKNSQLAGIFYVCFVSGTKQHHKIEEQVQMIVFAVFCDWISYRNLYVL